MTTIDSKTIPINSARSERRDPPANPEFLRQLEQMAGGLEANFVNFLIQQMKKTINKNGEDSTALKYYESMLDEQRADIMSSTRGGLGLKKLIMEQMLPSKRKEIHYRPNPLHEVPIPLPSSANKKNAVKQYLKNQTQVSSIGDKL